MRSREFFRWNREDWKWVLCAKCVLTSFLFSWWEKTGSRTSLFCQECMRKEVGFSNLECAMRSQKVIIKVRRPSIERFPPIQGGWIFKLYLRARQISGAISWTLTISNNEQFISDHWSFTMEAYPQRDPVVPQWPRDGPVPHPLCWHGTQQRQTGQVGLGPVGPVCECLPLALVWFDRGTKAQPAGRSNLNTVWGPFQKASKLMINTERV